MEHSIGIIGLGVMGAALARNAARNGAFTVVYNRTVAKVDAFCEKYQKEPFDSAQGKGTIVGRKSYEEFVAELPTPRAIVMMVEAGEAVDAVIADLLPLLQKGDILIDGGNSHYRDTERRIQECAKSGVRYLGMGVSGGARGALEGPSMMVGGDVSAYKEVESLFQKMAADDGIGGKCVSYLGSGGTGHFVKMAHNGIEYALMQILAEGYDYLRTLGKFTNEQLAETFEAWNTTEEMKGFLVEVTGKIFRTKDEGGKSDLIDLIADRAKTKGTGRWTVEAALSYGVPVPTIAAGLQARILSGGDLHANLRKKLPEYLDTSEAVAPPLKTRSYVRSASELSMILAYLQGFELLRVASEEEGWKLNLSEVARIWRGGCIIRSAMLSKFQEMFGAKDPWVSAGWQALRARFEGERQFDWRHIIDLATSRGIPAPAITSALAYYDGLRKEHLPQNLTQAQRDFFGAHTYERTDKKGEFHTEW